MFIFFKERSLQNSFLFKHQYKVYWIKDLVLTAWILTLSLVINFFHLPLYFYGIEIERFEFGLIVPFLLVGIIHLKYLLLVVFLLPFIDQLLHGHNVLLIPFEAIFNLMALLFLSLFKRLFLNQRSLNQFFFNVFFFISMLFVLIILKFIYFLIIFSIFLPQINFFTLDEKGEIQPFLIFSFLFFPFLLSSLRFIIILLVLIFLNRR